ncbi:MAG: TetR/AcrR family transcriptional regulator [Nevskia sp.]|nr:TetR/AcrR family transcriptional regulator [Nevskia sp.]
MEQNKPRRPRGRPRAYDPQEALGQAMQVFWDNGYAATSMDELGAATGMNRPSLYGAFGDKREIYLKAVQQYREQGAAAFQQLLDGSRPVREELRRLYRALVSVYVDGGKGGRGCFLIGTALTEAVSSPVVREVFAESLRGLDRAFEQRLRLAQRNGELGAAADPVALGRLASAIVHTLAIRSRAGEPQRTLERDIDAAVELICGG